MEPKPLNMEQQLVHEAMIQLINAGIDPTSEAGKAAIAQLISGATPTPDSTPPTETE